MGLARKASELPLVAELASVRTSLEGKRIVYPRMWEIAETLFGHMLNKTLSIEDARAIRHELERLLKDSPNYKWKYLADELGLRMRAYYEKHRIRLCFPEKISPSLAYAWLTPKPPSPRKASANDNAAPS